MNRFQSSVFTGGAPQFGVWSSLKDPVVLQVLANSDHDFLCVDLQHGYADPSDLPALLNAATQSGMPCLVRVAWNAPDLIMRALDLGAGGVLVPLVNNGTDAELAARSCRYPPKGERSWGPQWSEVREQREPDQANAHVRCIAMIETAQALANVSEIAATDGIDGLYIGQNDLSISLGIGRTDFTASEVLANAIREIVSSAKTNGILVGLDTAGRVSDVEFWASEGIDFYIVGRDIALINAGAADLSYSLQSTVK